MKPHSDKALALDLAADIRKGESAGLATQAAKFKDDPLSHVLWCYSWGPGEGPDEWQAKVLTDLGEALQRGDDAVRIAISSGHGPGKTALVAWLIRWFVDTREDIQCVATANTKAQLETKTWRELAKWHRRAKTRSRFKWSATRYSLIDKPDVHYATGIPWSKQNSEAFAGTHEKNVLMIYDEASAIDDEIWTVSEGAFTTPGCIWVACGNPTRNTGRFRECFGKFKHRWKTYQVDSRTAKMADNALIQKWVDDYGEDSDFVRVRVRGVFPRASTNQLIPVDMVEAAMKRRYQRAVIQYQPRILGVDVARFGDDQTVFIKRQGLVAFDLEKFRGMDTMTVAGTVATRINAWKPDAVFVDVGGLGAGVVDRLRQLGHSIIEVNAGNSPADPFHYFNLRAEMWGLMKDWLVDGGAIPDDEELRDDLIGPEYGFNASNKIQLEKKEDMKSRGLASPDCADALALTFAAPVAKTRKEDERFMPSGVDLAKMDYDVLGGVV